MGAENDNRELVVQARTWMPVHDMCLVDVSVMILARFLYGVYLSSYLLITKLAYLYLLAYLKANIGNFFICVYEL